MKVLGISGRHRDAAAALAVDGQLVAAASEDCFTRVTGIGYAQTGGFPSNAVAACLSSAGLEMGEIEQLTIVDGECASESSDSPDSSGLKSERIDAVVADAVQAAAGGSAVLVCSTQPATMALFVRDGEGLKSRGAIAGGDGLVKAARAVAATLGVPDGDPYQSLDRLSVGGDPEFENELTDVIRWKSDGAVVVDEDRLSTFMGAVRSRHAGKLTDAASLNVRLQETRRALAASFTCRVARVVRDASEDLAGRSNLGAIAFGGSMFASARLNTELRRLIGSGMSVAAVPELAGRALGAALAGSGSGSTIHPSANSPIHSLSLGPSFTDTDIKRTLDNCRLDYVYEPDWQRLYARVSRMLSQGKVVGWFQGAMAFGPRAMGTRSILCDPSGRYARHNMNEYLRQVPLDEPLPMAFAPSAAAGCLVQPPSVLATIDADIKPEWRDRLSSALDWRHYARVHAVSEAQAPQLCELLETHFKSMGVPGLIETNLSEPGQPVACTPRDAVRTVYSSAIDALVLGRFVLMKDHWLLRSNAG